MALVVGLFVGRQAWGGVAENVSEGAAIGAAPRKVTLPEGWTRHECRLREVGGESRLFCSRHLGCVSGCLARILRVEFVATGTGWRESASREAHGDDGRCGCCLDQF